MSRFASDADRLAYFTPLNDRIWGEGNWTACDRCLDDEKLPAFHHVAAHDEAPAQGVGSAP